MPMAVEQAIESDEDSVTESPANEAIALEGVVRRFGEREALRRQGNQIGERGVIAIRVRGRNAGDASHDEGGRRAQ